MIKYKLPIGRIAEAAHNAAHGVSCKYKDGEVSDEDDFTSRMAEAIEGAINSEFHPRVVCRAMKTTSKGPGSIEKKIGTDLVGVLNINTNGFRVKKGFLVQAKRLEPGAKLDAKEFRRLQEQCSNMLHITPDAFVFVYSKKDDGVRIIPALSVLSSGRQDILCLHSKGVFDFYVNHLTSFIGDCRIKVDKISDLGSLLNEYQAKHGLYIGAREVLGQLRIEEERNDG